MIADEWGYVHRFVDGAPTCRTTLLLLHGTGGNENALVELGRLLHPQAALLSPRGNVLENDMPRFFRRFAEGTFDQEDLRARTAQLAEFVTSAANAYRFDLERVIAVGYSNGANIAGSLLLSRPKLLAGAVLFHPMVPFQPQPLPDLTGVPVLISAGKADQIAQPEGTRRLEALLKSCTAAVTTHWQSGGHNIARDEVDQAVNWMSEHAA